MKFAAYILAFAASNVLSSPVDLTSSNGLIGSIEGRAASYTFEYYPKTGCGSGGKTATVSKCTNLSFAANSFKVTGTKLPNGCTLKGFQGKGCTSFENQYIDGPSLNTCDAAANSSGKFKSVQLNCD